MIYTYDDDTCQEDDAISPDPELDAAGEALGEFLFWLGNKKGIGLCRPRYLADVSETELIAEYRQSQSTACVADSVVGFSPVFWEHEDELPEMSDDDFGAIFPESRLTGGTIGVRVYPYVKNAHGNKIFISKPNAPGQPRLADNKKEV